jgi:hypothetical protein
MTGPEHYAEAERLLAAFDGFDPTRRTELPLVGLFMAEAQVHATLALAAATALGTEQYAPDSTAWHGAAATTPTTMSGER